MSCPLPSRWLPARRAGRRARRWPPYLGLALVVIATAQLMVVLDATIVNVALPHIQRALGFSGTGLEWVVNAYALAFGGLLLLGGRAGDLLGRRRMFIAGLLLFSAASLAGGLRHLPGVAAGRPRGPGRRRRAGRADRAGADRHHLPRGPAAQPGDGRVRRDERRRRRGRPDRRRPADHLRVLAVGAVRQRADRRRWPPLAAPRVLAESAAAAAAGSTCPARSPAPAGSALLVYGLSNAATEPATASPTGATPRSSPRSRRRRCCWPRFVVIETRSRARAAAAAPAAPTAAAPAPT